ncbi:MAG TPA: MerR family transcriptional regulator [Vicinamibacterales bacterium]|nr:MerR family transcriptional regulator [Vicinamibacterales bacterium]HOG27634.1 MerR family transcriptional regulator [Vicinamibacterales bacterium]HOQ58979.1 MerR family transcriptional regulator [Vicinamibacterales bacterium]HPK70423.1 MerR family transcriptional regulator [Vicinamibacterales bacterium]HPW20701.1 MerR family transcriptional regulator [Vicinamibacterales bacterium]
MRLKRYYSSRDVTALTGLSADQLRWWERQGLVQPAIAPRRTETGGYTERRYTPVDLLEIMVLADLRRRGFSLTRLRDLVDKLSSHFGVRLYEATGQSGPVTLLTDGGDVYVRTPDGRFFNLLKNPTQPLLVIGEEAGFKVLASRARPRKRRPKKPAAGA